MELRRFRMRGLVPALDILVTGVNRPVMWNSYVLNKDEKLKVCCDLNIVLITNSKIGTYV